MRAAAAMQERQAFENLQNPRYFIERFLWVIDKTRKQIPFKLNPPQERFIAQHTEQDLILKSRKEGFSTLIEAIWLHACLFNENENAVTMAHTWEDTVIHLDRVKFFIDTMGLRDVQMEVALDKDNQRELYFPHTRSRYWIGTAGSRAFGRGRDITRLHLSEVAHYADQSVITGVMEACVPHAWKVLETTANGIGELFYRLWQEAADPTSGSPWKGHFFSWYDDPTNKAPVPSHINVRLTSAEAKMQSDYKLSIEQCLWYRDKRASMAEREKMPQEYPSNADEAFLSSGRHVFNLEKIREKKARVVVPPYRGDVEDDAAHVRFRDDNEGRLRVWKMPRRGAAYLVAADVGEGVPEGDYSVAHVIDRESWEVVATWRGRLDPGMFGVVLCQLGVFYNDAVLIPELNNHGWAVIESIKRESYPHLLNTKEIWKHGETPKDGFPTNERTKALIITALRNANNDDTVYINDPITLSEMETFVQNDATGRMEAQEGQHDDCVMSLAIGVYCLQFLTVDATYAERNRPTHGSPIMARPVTPTPGRRSATGYR
jgi:hypothetical protein